MGRPEGKEAQQPWVRPGVGGTSPLWASVLSPEGRARRSRGRLPKGWPLQKTAARSIFAARGLQSRVEAGREGTGPYASPPHTRPATLTCPLARPPAHRSTHSARAWPVTCWGLGPTRPLPLRTEARRGHVPRWEGGTRLSSSGLHGAGLPHWVTSPRAQGPAPIPGVSSA